MILNRIPQTNCRQFRYGDLGTMVWGFHGP